MNVRPSPRATHLLPAAGCAAMIAGILTVSAQVKLPQANHAEGDNYLYPVRTMIAPIVRVRPLREDNRSAIVRKLSGIIIPAIEFHGTTLRDAVDQLRLESYQLDPDPDPITRGVKIVLRLPPPMPKSPTEEAIPIPGLPSAATGLSEGTWQPNEQTRITLTLNKIPLLEALHYVASQTGLRLEIQDYVVYLAPDASSSPGLITKELSVPPEVFGFPSAPPAPNNQGEVARSNGFEKPFLESRGISFPPGASATYLRRSQRLIIRNTQENIDRIESLSSPPTATP